MSDCNSIRDPKLHTTAVLYLPHNLPMPADVAAMQHRCKVRVLRLPITITRFGQINPAQIKTPGLLYLPHPYVVPGGLAVSTTRSGVQWDLPYGWAPTTFIAVEGMLAAHDCADAVRIAAQFNTTVRRIDRQTGDIYEKYDVVNATKRFQVTAGYHQNVIGFGWTNAVYLQFESLLHPPAAKPSGNQP